MVKKLILVVIAVVICLSTAYASGQLTEFEGYKGVMTSNIVFTGIGEDGLTPGDEVTATVTAKKEDDISQKAIFILTLTKDNKVVSVDMSEEKNIGVSETVFSAEVTVPSFEDASGYELNASLINPEYGFEPLSNPAYFPIKEEHRENPIKQIIIDGDNFLKFDPEEKTYANIPIIERFQNENAYASGLKYEYYPEMKIKPVDLGTTVSVSVEGAYPGNVKVNSKFYDDQFVDYNIGYSLRKHAVKGYSEDSDFDTDGYELYADDAIKFLVTESVWSPKKLFGNMHGNFDIYSQNPEDQGSRWHRDFSPQTGQRYQIVALDPLLEGNDYCIVYSEWNAKKYPDANLVEFEIDCDAEISIISSIDATYEGFQKAAVKPWIRLSYMNMDYVNAFTSIGLNPTYGFITDYLNLEGTAEQRIETLLSQPKFAYIKEAYENADEAGKAGFTAARIATLWATPVLEYRSYKFVEIPEGQESVKVVIPNYNEDAASYGPFIVIKPLKKVIN